MSLPNSHTNRTPAVASWLQLLLFLFIAGVPTASSFSVTPVSSPIRRSTSHTCSSQRSQSSLSLASDPESSPAAVLGQPTELPDSLQDAAQIAAQACAQLVEQTGGGVATRCRIDFDTSAGDETYTLLKQTTEFLQHLVTSLAYLQLPQLQQQRQDEMMKVAQAQTELKTLVEAMDATASDDTAEKSDTEESEALETQKARLLELETLIANHGRDPDYVYEGPLVRIYFPDEGSAALAKRDWMMPTNGGPPLVPPCVAFSSCGGVRTFDVTNDKLVLFTCPKASESDSVEKLLEHSEQTASQLQLSILVNPNLVDMGVTGFGMAGRLLRERLIDPLPNVYYLRTLQWGALTRVWPRDFSVWQEDENADGGYRLIRTLPTLPSNPEVEDIYDVENGLQQAKGEGGGMLDQFGDFVNGMMRL